MFLGNKLFSEGGEILGEILKENSSLSELLLTGENDLNDRNGCLCFDTRIDEDGTRALAAGLEFNSSLSNLVLARMN